MRTPFGLTVAVLLVLGTDAALAVSSPAIQAPAPAPAAQSWTELKPEGGRFRVLFPGTPTHERQEVPTRIGPILMQRWALEIGTTVYQVIYADYPESYVKSTTADAILDSGVAQMRESVKAGSAFETLIPIALAGHPGREHVQDVDGFVMKGRSLLVGTRLFQVLSGGPSDRRAAMMPDINRFLDSFALVFAPETTPVAASAQVPAQATVQQPSARTWTEVRSLDSGFLVEFPAAPQQSDTSVKNPDGTPSTTPMRRWMIEMDNGWTAYFVAISDISTARRQSATTDEILSDAVRGGLNQAPGSTLVSATPIEFQGHPGREVILTTSDGTSTMRIRARMVLAGLRLYQQIAVTSERSKLEPGEVDRYFKSFLLLAR